MPRNLNNVKRPIRWALGFLPSAARHTLSRALRGSFEHALFWLPTAWRLRIEHFRRFGDVLHLKHPKRFNEKIEWRKIYQRNPEFARWSDKIAVKPIAAERIGPQHIIETLWHGERLEEAPLESLPFPYIIKVNTGSKRNYIVRTADDINRAALNSDLTSLAHYNPITVSDEWHYSLIKPQILIEKLLLDENNSIPEDYKFHIFHGKTKSIQVDTGRFTGHRRQFYTRDWEPLSTKLTYDLPDTALPKPANLLQAIKIAEKLAEPFDYVRIDLYLLRENIYFGEATFTPGGGREIFEPYAQDRIWGDWWKQEPYNG